MSIVPQPQHSIHYLTESFERLNNCFKQNPFPKISDRILGLKKLRKAIINNRLGIVEALKKDFSKPSFEADSSEILIVLREISSAIKNLKYWTQNQAVDADWLLFGSRSYIRFEPKGVVLIISPWNYPFNLSISPLVAAYAAGNKIILKPSEFCTATSTLIHKIICESFTSDEVSLIQADAKLSYELSCLPFNFIFFTGSTTTAKVILQAASQNLTPVVLELGGKCPVIIAPDFPLSQAIEHIAFAKLLNAGQTCIAPDFICLHTSQREEFIRLWEKFIINAYKQKILEDDDYCGIINDKHLNRLVKLVEKSIDQGATANEKLSYSLENKKIKPILLYNLDWDNEIMKEEIFGPILPILEYDDADQLKLKLQDKNRPLNLYIFSKNKNFVADLIESVRSGGITINQCLLNYIDLNLPFGGDHQSGMGQYHGVFGFKTFSHMRAISKQTFLPSTLKLFHPPYSNFKMRIKNLLIKIYS